MIFGRGATSEISQHVVFYRCANFHACNQKLNNSVQFVHHILALKAQNDNSFRQEEM